MDTNQNPNPAPVDPAIVSAAQQVAQRHGLRESPGQTGTHPNGAPPAMVGADIPSSGSEMFSKSVQAVVRCFDGYMSRKLARAAFALTSDRGFVENFVAEARVTEDELEQIGELSAVVAQKYALMTAYAPEIGLAVVLVGYGARIVDATRTLQHLAARRAAKETEAKA